MRHLAATIPQRAFPRQDVQHRGGDARAHTVATQPRQRRNDDGRGVAHTHAVTRGAPRGASGAAHVARFLARELPSAHGATLARGIARGKSDGDAYSVSHDVREAEIVARGAVARRVRFRRAGHRARARSRASRSRCWFQTGRRRL